MTHFINALKQRPLIVVPTVIKDALDIPFRRPSKRKEGLRFSSNEKPAILNCIEEWFDAIAISRRNKETRLRVVETEGELSAKMGKKGEAIKLVQSYDNLAITMTFELIASGVNQLFTNMLMIV